MRRCFSLVPALSLALSSVLGVAPASAQRAPVACANLKLRPPAHTSIVRAELVPAGTFTPPVPNMFGPPTDYSTLPAFCRVVGSIKPTTDSDVRFELWLPAAGWNGTFLQTGNGGAAGLIDYGSMATPLSRGFAFTNTDTGHEGTPDDFSWVVGHPERFTDFAYRAVHELTVVGKALTAEHYGRAPVKAFWEGCSTGGRQGLMEAQRYPEDYDAIIAGAPASNWTPLMALGVLIQRTVSGPDGLSAESLTLLHESALAQCDALDGVKDRVITDPTRCAFTPASIRCAPGVASGCLSAGAVAAAERIYRGVVTRDGTVRIPGTGPGSEPLWGAYAGPFQIGSNYFRYVVARDPQWTPARFDVDADLARAGQLQVAAPDAMNPDLGRFFARGGKLLTYHGTTDGLIPYGNSVNYYESVVAKLGKEKVERSARLYLVPGMDHCFDGEGAFVIDWLRALDEWAKSGTAPDAVPARHPAQVAARPSGAAPAVASKAFTRPVCPYPKMAKYTGSGDTADASNFACAMP